MTIIRLNSKEEISSVCFCKNQIIIGTYVHIKDDNRIGGVYYLESEQNIKLICQTSGTFQVISNENIIYAVCSKEIIKIENMKVSQEIKTTHMNLQIAIFENQILIAQSDGMVSLYDLNLNLIKKVKICDHMIWCCNINDSYIFSGCDCGKFCVIRKNDMSIIKLVKRNSGVTSIHFKDNKVYVGSYDEEIFVYDMESLEKMESKNIGGGIWRIVNFEKNMAVACMYEGVKIVDENLNIIDYIKTEGIAYAIDYGDEKLVYSSFYEKYLEINYLNK